MENEKCGFVHPEYQFWLRYICNWTIKTGSYKRFFLKIISSVCGFWVISRWLWFLTFKPIPGLHRADVLARSDTDDNNKRCPPDENQGNHCLFSGQDETLTGPDEVIVSGRARSNQKWRVALEPILVAGMSLLRRNGGTGRLHDKQSALLTWRSWMWHCRREQAVRAPT